MISYDGLWALLSEFDISKMEFMNQIGVSSATMAKLSNNQPVTMDILERICSCLRCSLDSIVSFSDGPDTKRQWRGISVEETYLVYFYFVQDSNQGKDVNFLYGYACPFCMTKEGLERWSLSKYRNFHNILELSGYSTGENLLKTLKLLEQNQTFGQIMEENEIKVACNGCKEVWKDIIFLLSPFRGMPQYRPAYILESRERNSRIINVFRPQVAIGDYLMRCESLVCGNPRELYCKNLKPDAQKVKELSTFLKTIYSAASVNDMARLGCFELLSYLNETSKGECGIQWKIKENKERKTGQAEGKSLEIVLDHRIFPGCYGMLVRICNTQNNFLEHLEMVNCNGKDYVYDISLYEQPGFVEIRLYKLSGNSFESNLVADSSATLMRNIFLNINMIDRRFQLEDSWTEMMRKNGKKVDATAEYALQQVVSIGNQENEVWFENERIVREDCGQIMNTNSKESQGIFLEEGDDMHIRFLRWLKQTLDHVSCKRVVIIDPYIDGDAIAKILRGITNPSLVYDIYTANDDSKNTGARKNGRIDEIKKVLEQLRMVTPFSLHVYAVSGDVLHDRFLILEGDDLSETKVYSMTNSLDNVGQHHSSLVVPLNQWLASEVNEYYLGLVEKKKEENKIEEVFSLSKPDASISVDMDMEQRKVIQSIEEYRELCENNFGEALSQLAYLAPGELKNNCEKELTNLNNFSGKIKLLLDHYWISVPDKNRERNNMQHQVYEERRVLGLGQTLLKDMDWNLSLMDSAYRINEYYADYLHSYEPWYLQNAVRYFCRFETREAVTYLSGLYQSMKKEQPNIQLRKYKVAAMMTIRFTELLKYKEERKLVSNLMLASDVPFLRGIVIANSFLGNTVFDEKCIENIPKELECLSHRLTFEEQLIAHVYVIQKLQICYYRRGECYKFVQPIIDEIIGKLVLTICDVSLKEDADDGISNDDLYDLLHVLYSRNSEDVCKTYALLVECKYMEPKKASEYLQKMLLEPFEKTMKNEKDIFYRVENLYESKMILSYIHVVHPSSIKELFHQIKKMERMIMAILYSATLKEQNYRLWKCYMDMFCCFVYLELWAEQKYQYKPSKAVAEFQAISLNYESVLKQYSEVYQKLIEDYEI